MNLLTVILVIVMLFCVALAVGAFLSILPFWSVLLLIVIVVAAQVWARV